MSLIRNTLLALSLLVSGSIFAQEKTDSANYDHLLSFGMGTDFVLQGAHRQYSFSGSYFNRDLSTYVGGRAFLLTSVGNEVWKYDNIIEVSPLYAKGISTGRYDIIAGTGISVMSQHLSGGVRKNPGALFSAYDYQQPVTTYGIGLPLHVQVSHRFGKKTGISLIVYANVNTIGHYFGTTLNILIL